MTQPLFSAVPRFGVSGTGDEDIAPVVSLRRTLPALLRGRIASGDRVAAELLLAGGGDPGTAEDGPEHVIPRSGGWRAAALSYCEHGLAEAVAVLDRVQPGELPPNDRAQFFSQAAVWCRVWGDTARSRDFVLRAGEPGRHLDAASRAARHRGIALLASQEGDEALGDEHYRAAVELRGGTQDTLLALMMTLYRARYALARERFTEAVAESEAAVRLSRMPGHSGFEPFALSIGADAKAHLGRLGDALADAVYAVRLRETSGLRHDGAFGLVVLGRVYRRRREANPAREALEAAIKDLPGGPDGRALEAAALAELGRVRAAEDPRLANEYTLRSVEMSRGDGRIAALLARAWVALMNGDTVAATADAEEVKAAASLGDRPAATAEAWELLGLTANEPRAAASRFHEAGLLHRAVGDRIGEARVRMAAAAVRGAADSRSVRWEEDTLRHQGVRLAPGVADTLTVLARQAPLVAVRGLGGFRVIRGGSGIAPGEWQSKKARDLLKILVSHRGRPVPRPRLMELLWPGLTPSTGGNRLSVQLSTLRRVLDPDRRIRHADLIIADRAAVAVNLDLVEVDVERFLIAASEACAAHRHGDADASELLSAAEALYVGEFMPEDPYADWAQELRDEAEAAYVGVLRAQVASSSEVDHRVACLARILRCDSYDEEAHLELVRVLRQAGRHGEATRRYRAYARCMQEIGVAPAPLKEISRHCALSAGKPEAGRNQTRR